MADKRWYAVHTYSGFENKAKKSLEEKIRMEGLQDSFGEILIPMGQRDFSAQLIKIQNMKPDVVMTTVAGAVPPAMAIGTVAADVPLLTATTTTVPSVPLKAERRRLALELPVTSTMT